MDLQAQGQVFDSLVLPTIRSLCPLHPSVHVSGCGLTNSLITQTRDGATYRLRGYVISRASHIIFSCLSTPAQSHFTIHAVIVSCTAQSHFIIRTVIVSCTTQSRFIIRTVIVSCTAQLRTKARIVWVTFKNP
jgi:hypothetical protein